MRAKQERQRAEKAARLGQPQQKKVCRKVISLFFYLIFILARKYKYKTKYS